MSAGLDQRSAGVNGLLEQSGDSLPRGAGALYIFTAPQGVKVGITLGDVERRRYGIECASGTPVLIAEVFRFDGTLLRATERRAHELLAEHRTYGEWFSCNAKTAIEAVEKAARTTVDHIVAEGRERLRERSTERPLPPSLREVRHLCDLSLSDVAEVTGIHKGRISELERGERAPRTSDLNLLAAAYGIPGWRVLCLIVVDEGGA